MNKLINCWVYEAVMLCFVLLVNKSCCMNRWKKACDCYSLMIGREKAHPLSVKQTKIQVGTNENKNKSK